MSRPRTQTVLCAVFFLSGAAALVFESLWFRQAGLAFGNSLWASSLVLSSFMAGLALGNGLASRLSHRLRSPEVLYAKVELLVAVTGVLLVLSLPRLGEVLAPFWRVLLPNPALLNGTRLVLAFVLLMVPSTAMGLTLPLLVKSLSADGSTFGSRIGRLYGWNTIGALAGVLLVETVLLESFGIRGAALCAAFLNGVAALGALAVSRNLPSVRGQDDPEPVRARLNARARRCLVATFLAGATLLALEVVWFRFLQLFMPGTTLTFAVMLAIVLAGIGLGSLIAGRVFRRWPTFHRHDAALALIAGTTSLVVYLLLSRIITHDRNYVEGYGLRFPGLCVLLMLPVSTLSGALFTVIGQRLQQEMGDETRSAGLLSLANTIGAALGPLVAGFLLLPAVGMEMSFYLLSCSYAVVALLLAPGPGFSLEWVREKALLGGAAGLIVSLMAFPFGPMDRYFDIASAGYRAEGVQLAARREGTLQTMQYLRSDFLGEAHSYRLVTNSYSMSGTFPLAKRYMEQYVVLPAALHPDLEHALLISFGTGSTAAALTRNASLSRITVVDISADILEMADVVFPEPGSNPLDDPRVEAIVEDGRFYLQTTDRLFDLITSEPPPPKMAGVVSLYTREYFQLIHSRLRAGGMATYWLPVKQLQEEEAKAVVRAFLDVFGDETTLWTGAGTSWMLMGTKGVAAVPSEEHFSAQWSDTATRAGLDAIGFERPGQLCATFLMDAPDLRRETEGVAPLTDNHPSRMSAVFGSDPAGLSWFAEVMDTDAARARFESSDYLEALLPDGVRRRTLPFFASQEIVNRIVAPRLYTTLQYGHIDFIVRQTSLEAPVLWANGSDGRRQEILRAKGDAAATDAHTQYERAVGHLARRDFHAASRGFAKVQGLPPALVLPTRVYVHCLLEEWDQVSELLEAHPDAFSRVFRSWLAKEFPEAVRGS